MVKVAIIGTGAISDVHIQAYRAFSDRCQIVAMVNDEVDRAQAKAKQYNLDVPIYATWQQLLESQIVDLASICLPPFVHAPATIDLLKAGSHVLLEKPMAPSLEDCDTMLAAAEKSNRLLSVVAQNRYKTPMMKLKSVLDAGWIGKMIHAQVDSYWWRGRNYYDMWWRGTWEKEGGGCTLNHAVHHIDLFQWMMGMPSEVRAVVTNLNHTNSEVEDFSTTVFRFEDGRLGQLTASLVHHGEEQRLAFQGERASVAAPWKVLASRQRENGFPDPDPEYASEIEAFYQQLPEVAFDGHMGQVDNLLGAIYGDQSLLIDGLQGRNTMELVTAIYQSGITGNVVRLPLPVDAPFYTRQGILTHAPHFHEKTHSVKGFSDEQITLGSSYRDKS